MCNYHRPVCVACRIDLRPEKNGVEFVEDDGQGNAYKIWNTDMWSCPGCQISVLIGFPSKAWAQNHEPDFDEKLEKALADPYTVRERTPEEKKGAGP